MEDKNKEDKQRKEYEEWLNSFGYDKNAIGEKYCFENSSKKFLNSLLNNKYNLLLFIIFLPIILQFILKFNRDIFAFNISANNITNVEWFLFYGSYLAGILTLFGVVLTINHNRKQIFYNSNIHNTNKEAETIANILAKMDIRFYQTFFNTFKNLKLENENSNNDIIIATRSEIQKRLSINSYSWTVLQSLDIASSFEMCINCSKKCNLYKVEKTFNEEITTMIKFLDEYLFLLGRFLTESEENTNKTSEKKDQIRNKIENYYNKINSLDKDMYCIVNLLKLHKNELRAENNNSLKNIF